MTTKNKYAICYSLYDINNLSETNLYYYKGIIHTLGFYDRDFDIYIDTTEYCKNKLLNICKQENYNLNNVYFNIHNTNNYKLWNLYTCINKCLDYDIICLNNTYMEKGLKYFSMIEDLNDHKHSIFYIDDNIYIKSKKLITTHDKLYYIIDKLYNNIDLKHKDDLNKIIKSLFIKEYLNDNIIDITKNLSNDKWYWLNNDIRKSIYFKEDYYTLEDNKCEFTYRKPINYQNVANISNLKLYSNIISYINDVSDKIIVEKNISHIYDLIQNNNKKRCIVYCVDDNKKINKLLKYSLKTYYEYNDLDCYIVTVKNNVYIQDILNNFPQIKIIYVDNIYNEYLLGLDKKVRPEISKFAYIKIFIPIIEELKNNYDYVLVCDADVEHYHKINEEFLELYDGIDIIGHTQYDDDKCINSIKEKIGGEYTNQYINCGYFIYNIKNKCFNKDYYLPLLLKYINISNSNNFNNFEQDALLIFKELNIKQFNSTYIHYCYQLDKNTNHNNYQNIHYICGGKDIMLQHCHDNIVYYPKKDFDNIYIYSNYNPHGEKYRNIIQNKIKQENNIHVFLNTCVPLQLNKQYYENTTNYFFGRCVDEPKKFDNQKYFGEKYSLENLQYWKRYFIINNRSNNYKIQELVNRDICDIQNDGLYNTYYNLNKQINPNHEFTSGFIVYLFMKEMYPNKDIYLVDFYGPCNKDKICFIHQMSTHHKIDTEYKFYMNNNVNILYT
jgi:hypothetical protein